MRKIDSCYVFFKRPRACLKCPFFNSFDSLFICSLVPEFCSCCKFDGKSTLPICPIEEMFEHFGHLPGFLRVIPNQHGFRVEFVTK